MKDIGGYFKITDCFLCGEKADLDFNCLFNGEIYRAYICSSCFVSYGSDLELLSTLLKKANKLHTEQEKKCLPKKK